MKKEEIPEEFDIPIYSMLDRLKLGICFECGKRKAKYLCDYVKGKSFDLYGKGIVKESTCSKYLCEKCRHKLNGQDFCKEHFEILKKEIIEANEQIK